MQKETFKFDFETHEEYLEQLEKLYKLPNAPEKEWVREKVEILKKSVLDYPKVSLKTFKSYSRSLDLIQLIALIEVGIIKDFLPKDTSKNFQERLGSIYGVVGTESRTAFTKKAERFYDKALWNHPRNHETS